MKKVVIIVLTIFFLSKEVSASSSVVINEFQTATPQQVELYNNGTAAVDVSNWYIDDSGGTTYFTIPENTILSPGMCLSFSASFGFNTSTADTARLFNSTAAPTATNAQLVDSFSYDKITDTAKNFQRIPDGSSIWVASVPSIDQLNLTGTPCTPPPTPTATPTPTRTPTPTKTPTPTPTEVPQTTYTTPSTYDNVFITETLPNPESGQNEWVELYNHNDFPITLENWFIDDGIDTGANPYKFFLPIAANAYEVVDLPSAMFNNDGDTVWLLDRNEIQKDSITYQSVKEKYTVNRNTTPSTIVCFALPSRGAANNLCVTPTTTLEALSLTISPQPGSETASPTAAKSSRATDFAKTSAVLPVKIPRPLPSISVTRHTFGMSSQAPKILGSKELNPLINGMLAVSISCSLLTIGAVLIKMKSW